VRVFVLELRLYNIYTGEKAATALFFMGGRLEKRRRPAREKNFCDFCPSSRVLSLSVKSSRGGTHKTKTLVAS